MMAHNRAARLQQPSGDGPNGRKLGLKNILECERELENFISPAWRSA
jgi:hypothetical protein